MLIRNWKEVLKKSAVVWVGVIGAVLPELPDLILKWLASDASAEVLTPSQKSWLRAGILLFVIPVARVWQQTGAARLRPDNAEPVQAVKPLSGDPL